MKDRWTTCLLIISMLIALAWVNANIAREHAQTEQLYADTAGLLYQAKVQNIRSQALLLEARATYAKALRAEARKSE